MACNYGWFELFKIFVDYKANVQNRDKFFFSSLLYSLKSNSHAIFYYLLYLGVDINDFD